jgi:hypothetical protein
MNQKSFYGKAWVIGEGESYWLESFGAIVAYYGNARLQLVADELLFTPTTRKHVHEFALEFAGVNLPFDELWTLYADNETTCTPIYHGLFHNHKRFANTLVSRGTNQTSLIYNGYQVATIVTGNLTCTDIRNEPAVTQKAIRMRISRFVHLYANKAVESTYKFFSDEMNKGWTILRDGTLISPRQAAGLQSYTDVSGVEHLGYGEE